MYASRDFGSEPEIQSILQKAYAVDSANDPYFRALTKLERLPMPELPATITAEELSGAFLLQPVDGRKVYTKLCDFLELSGFNFVPGTAFALKVDRPGILDACYINGARVVVEDHNNPGDSAPLAIPELKAYSLGNLIFRDASLINRRAGPIVLQTGGLRPESTFVSIQKHPGYPVDLTKLAQVFGWDAPDAYPHPSDFGLQW